MNDTIQVEILSALREQNKLIAALLREVSGMRSVGRVVGESGPVLSGPAIAAACAEINLPGFSGRHALSRSE
ncbi:hypothetical protein ACJ41P_10385 [Azospirillum argentinense]|uniref:Uncharacterized protein n=1 Tax=Azospirillum argentinense TaxID=2970906 RepID=A0ABW8V4V0_9PROT